MGIANLLVDEFGDDISGVHVNGTDGHDFLSVSLTELPDQHGDECVQLSHLLLEVILQCVLISLLQTTKRDTNLSRPPNLSTTQSHLVESKYKTMVLLEATDIKELCREYLTGTSECRYTAFGGYNIISL